MKKLSFIIGATVLILSFQNCGQPMNSISANPSGNNQSQIDTSSGLNGGSEGGSKLVSMKGLEVPMMGSVLIEEDAVITTTQSNLNSGGAGVSRLLVSLENGLVTEELVNGVKNNFCLTKSEVSELQSIVYTSNVCEQQSSDENTMCSMVMGLPYGSLYNSQEKVVLGESRDGCGNGKKSLCGEKDDMLKAFIAHLKSNYRNRSCQ